MNEFKRSDRDQRTPQTSPAMPELQRFDQIHILHRARGIEIERLARPPR